MTDEMLNMEDENSRKRFWVFVKSDLGLTEDEAHEALAVPSVKDFEGTKRDAMARLKEYAQDIGLRRLIKSLVPEYIGHSEARVVAWGDMFAPDGTRVNITAREGTNAETVAATALAWYQGAQILARLGWTLAAENGKAAAATLAQDSATTDAIYNRSVTADEDVASAIVKAGVAALDTIKVDPDGKVEFHVDGFRWPFKDSRGANVVMGYVDADLGIAEGDLQPGANIATPGIVVEWEKPDKYYNVTRVRRLNK